MGEVAVAYVGLGSNLGDRRANLRAALRLLSRHGRVSIAAVSGFYETEPVGGPPQPDFLNAVAALETNLTPPALLRVLQGVESRLGRRRTVRWGPRSIDLDLLLYEERVVEAPGLSVPHPRMHERLFVLEPLCEIAPGAIHPVLRKTVAELLEELRAP